jgi:hypothetical protein
MPAVRKQQDILALMQQIWAFSAAASTFPSLSRSLVPGISFS